MEAAPADEEVSGTDPPEPVDARRICELLARFDPQRLRTEFKEFYRHRLHHTAAVGAATVPRRVADEAAALGRPAELGPRSRALAGRVAERRREAVGATASHDELLKWWAVENEERKEALRARKRAEEESDCTFRPQVLRPRTPRASALVALALLRRRGSRGQCTTCSTAGVLRTSCCEEHVPLLRLNPDASPRWKVAPSGPTLRGALRATSGSPLGRLRRRSIPADTTSAGNACERPRLAERRFSA